MFANLLFQEGLVSRIYKEYSKLDSKKTIRKWAKNLNRWFNKEREYMFNKQDPQMENKCKKTCSPSLAIGEMPNEAPRR